MTKTFATYHPAVNFAFFAGAIGLSMFISHPLFSLVSLIISFSYYLTLSKGKSKKFLLWYIVMFIAVVFFNGVMNTMGNTVLFIWLKNRPVTFEALFYGAVTGINFVSVMLWFSCYNIIMTTDKFTYLFGRFAPSITLVLSMILRLIPNLIKKTRTIIGARNCIGKGTAGNTFKDKLNNGLETLSILTSCALEDAVITADSMRSRGYVDDNHTSYHTYKKQNRDIVVAVLFAVTAVAVIICIFTGCTQMQFLPAIVFPKTTVFTYIGITGYALFLSIPLIIEFSEEITWHILKSKI